MNVRRLLSMNWQCRLLRLFVLKTSFFVTFTSQSPSRQSANGLKVIWFHSSLLWRTQTRLHYMLKLTLIVGDTSVTIHTFLSTFALVCFQFAILLALTNSIFLWALNLPQTLLLHFSKYPKSSVAQTSKSNLNKRGKFTTNCQSRRFQIGLSDAVMEWKKLPKTKKWDTWASLWTAFKMLTKWLIT